MKILEATFENNIWKQDLKTFKQVEKIKCSNQKKILNNRLSKTMFTKKQPKN